MTKFIELKSSTRLLVKIFLSTYSGVHLLVGEFFAFSDGASSSLLESNSLKSLMHVQCVISGRSLHLLFLSVFGTGHPRTNQLINNT